MTNTGALESGAAGRPYQSPLRRAQAETTRSAVLDAAAALFVREGYLRTTMKAIAAEAGTSVETVYAQGSKAALLLACVDRALAGDDDDVPLTDRAEFTAALAQPSAAAAVEAFVRALAHVAERVGGLRRRLRGRRGRRRRDRRALGRSPSSTAGPTSAAWCRPWPTADRSPPAGTSTAPPTPCGSWPLRAPPTSRCTRSAGPPTGWSTAVTAQICAC